MKVKCQRFKYLEGEQRLQILAGRESNLNV